MGENVKNWKGGEEEEERITEGRSQSTVNTERIG